MPTVFEQIFGNGQGGAQGLLGNPAFMVGSGLLSNQGNPWGGAIQGLAAAQGYKLSESKMKKDEEKEKRLSEMQAIQMKALQDAQARQEYTKALLAAGSSQSPGLLQDPTYQAQLRQKAAAYGDPAALEQGGLLAPMPTAPKSTSLITNLQAMGIDPQSEQGRAIMMQSITKPQTQVSMGASVPAPPSGWWYNNPNDPSAGLYRIPGGPAEVEAATTAATDEKRKQGTLAQIGQVTNTIDETIQLADRWTTGSIGGIAKVFPETDARKLAGNILTIKANLGFDRLQKMREESPTGGALGQVAVQELEGLQATVAMLDQLQKPEDVKAALAKIRAHYQGWANAVTQANSGAQAAPQPAQSDVDALVRKYTGGN